MCTRLDILALSGHNGMTTKLHDMSVTLFTHHIVSKWKVRIKSLLNTSLFSQICEVKIQSPYEFLPEHIFTYVIKFSISYAHWVKDCKLCIPYWLNIKQQRFCFSKTIGWWYDFLYKFILQFDWIQVDPSKVEYRPMLLVHSHSIRFHILDVFHCNLP